MINKAHNAKTSFFATTPAYRRQVYIVAKISKQIFVLDFFWAKAQLLVEFISPRPKGRGYYPHILQKI